MGIPIPLGAVHDKRTLIALDNLIDLIATCVDHPGASNQLFLAGDSEDLSTTELLRHMVAASGKRNVLFPVPVNILRLLAIVLRQQFAVKQLCSSLQIDSSKAQNVLHWHPVISAEQAVKEAVNSYHRDREATT
jgi:nucleoside-diphosphate-sugar epimerase